MTLHLKALALFRIALAAVVLADLGERLPLLPLFLSDQGYLPRQHLSLAYPSFWPSLYLFSGSAQWALSLWSVHLVAALALMVGVGTRWAAPLTWYLTLSLQQRNPFVLNMGDSLLLCLLFWGMLLPWARQWSVDARFSKEKPPPTTIRSWASTGLTLQISMVYLFSALHKLLDPFWRDGEALSLAFQGRLFARVGGWAPPPYQGLEIGVIAGETLLAVGLLVPSKRLRRAAIVLAVAFHLATFATLALGLFPWVAIAGLLALWPGGPKKEEPAPPLRAPRGAADLLSLLALSLAIAANLASLAQRLPHPLLYRLASVVSANQSWRFFTGESLTQDRATRIDIADNEGSISTTVQIRGPRGWRDDLYWQRLHEPRYRALLEPFVSVATREWSKANPGLAVTGVTVSVLNRTLGPGQAPGETFRQPLWPPPESPPARP